MDLTFPIRTLRTSPTTCSSFCLPFELAPAHTHSPFFSLFTQNIFQSSSSLSPLNLFSRALVNFLHRHRDSLMEDDTFHQFHQSYPTSNARSEPFPTCTSTRHWIVSPSSQPPSPPLWTAPPPPVKIKQGIWRDGEDILRSSDWPPVQQYLSETRWNKTLAPAPSEIVFALAALEVLHQPYNPVHWLFWGAGPLSNTSKTVNRIARTSSGFRLPPLFPFC